MKRNREIRPHMTLYQLHHWQWWKSEQRAVKTIVATVIFAVLCYVICIHRVK